MREITFELPASDVHVDIELDEAAAPESSRALTSLLPLSGTVIHSRRSGQEIFVVLPAVSLPDGPRVTELQPGDVIAAIFPAFYRDAPPPSIHDPAQPYTHLGLIYGPDARFSTPEGYVPVLRLGRVAQGLDGLARACTAIRSHGVQPYHLHLLT